jgi:RNA polymerase sigma-70 factor (ECF subfamily)
LLAGHRRVSVRRAALAGRLREELAMHPPIEAPDDAVRRVRELIADLPETDREIIGLSYWEGFSLVEVARILDMPPATVRSRHARAKARLRDALLQDELPPDA